MLSLEYRCDGKIVKGCYSHDIPFCRGVLGGVAPLPVSVIC